MYDLPASSNKAIERWSYSNIDLVVWIGCALTENPIVHSNQGAAGIIALTQENMGVKAAKK